MSITSPTHRLRLCIGSTILGCFHTVGALAIPLGPEDVTTAAPTAGSMHLKHPRVDSEIITLYGTFDDESDDKDSGLAPIGKVLQMMLTQPPPSPTIETPSPVATAISPPETPPRQGPGIVLLSSTVLPGFTATSASVEPTQSTSGLTANDTADRSALSASRTVILGSIVGGIVCLTIFLFLMLNPSITGKFCGLVRRRPFKRSKPDRGISNIADSSFSAAGSPNRTLVDRQDKSKGSEKGEGTLVDVDLGGQSLPLSKFSIYSSEYLSPSTRDSSATATSISVSMLPGRPSVVTFAAAPNRPPRPPTADSPALSDSVYFACERHPYVVAADPMPQAAERVDRTESVGAPKKNLTPSEFFALHVPMLLSSLTGAGKAVGASRDRSVSAVSARRTSTTGSQHSRTKSAPLLGLGLRGQRTSKSTTALEQSEGGNSAPSPGEIAKKVTRHRRSRSASGWAYPDRPKTRRVVNA